MMGYLRQVLKLENKSRLGQNLERETGGKFVDLHAG